MARLTIHVPRSAGVNAKGLKAILGHAHVADLRISRGRITDVVELDVDDKLTPETEGEIRAGVAELLERDRADSSARLEIRVAELEAEVAQLKGHK